jgi:hypothetical protein
VGQVAIDRRLMGQEPDAPATEQRRASMDQPVQARLDARHARRAYCLRSGTTQ